MSQDGRSRERIAATTRPECHCHGKVPYATAGRAWTALAAWRKRPNEYREPGQLHAYKCRVCNAYHLGRTRQEMAGNNRRSLSMYKVASDKSQGRVSRVLPKHMPAAPVVLTAAEERDSIVKRLAQIRAEMSGLTKASPRRHELGQLHLELQMRLTALKPKKTPLDRYQQHFLESAKEMLPTDLFRAVESEARQRAIQDPDCGEIAA